MFNMSDRVTNQPATDPWVEIIEQPAPRSQRFRYDSENVRTGSSTRTTGGIQGASSTVERPSFPTIKVHNHKGSCVVVVSCVTLDDPKAKAHPHSLVGADCSKGVCTKKIKTNLDRIQFSSLGIQCVKKADIISALDKRKEIRVDPYRAGFAHASESGAKDIDLSVVRLCFQVFLPDSSGKYTRAVPPVCTNPVFDKKTASELLIVDYLPESCSLKGQEKMLILTQKLPKDVEVRFFEMDGQTLVWESFADLSNPKDIHQQVALRIRTPQYTRGITVTSEVKLWFELRKKNSDEASEPRAFTYFPNDQAYRSLKRKATPTVEPIGAAGAPKKVKNEVDENIPTHLASLETSSLSSVDPNSLQSGANNPISTLGSTAGTCTNPSNSQPQQSYYTSGVSGLRHPQQVSSDGQDNDVLPDSMYYAYTMPMYQLPSASYVDYPNQVMIGEGGLPDNMIITGQDAHLYSGQTYEMMDDQAIQQALQELPPTSSAGGSMSLGGLSLSGLNEFLQNTVTSSALPMNPNAPSTENYGDVSN